MESQLSLRAATAQDARRIAMLFRISSDGVADYVWSQLAREGESLLEVGAARYARPEGAFSYRNCLLAVWSGEAVGMLHSYPMAEADGVPEPDPVLRPYAELELPGSLYLSGMALFPSHRRRGIGARLLEAAEARARDEGLQSLSLLVFEANEGALRLYERSGFAEVERRAVVPHALIRHRGDVILMARRLAG